MSILLSAVAAAAFALSGSPGAAAEPRPTAQIFVDSPARSTPIVRLQRDASSWESAPEGEIRFRVTLPTAAEASSPVNVGLHWADSVKDVNNAAGDRDARFVWDAQR